MGGCNVFMINTLGDFCPLEYFFIYRLNSNMLSVSEVSGFSHLHKSQTPQ